jgi:hypothetical protein
MQREPEEVAAVVETRAEQAMQVDRVIGMVVGQDDRVQAGSGGGLQERKQPRRGP